MSDPPNLARDLAAARARTDELFRTVNPEALYERPVAERHRLIFYLGHLEAFDWNLIARGAHGTPVFHPTFDQLFAFGIDPEPGQLPQDKPSEWPSIEEVKAYQKRVRDKLEGLVEETPAQLLHVAIEHRLMHAETFTYLTHQLAPEHKRGPTPRAEPERPVAENPLVEIPAGAAAMGRGRADGFGWDNEFEGHIVAVPAFAINKYKVSNGEYLNFVREGAKPPHFWVRRGDRFHQRVMFGEVPLPLDWPVYVTLEEAAAYAAWAGRALPSEAQFQRAAYVNGRAAVNGACDFRGWDPVSVAGAENELGVAQMIGNGWEWTSTVFEPFRGFEPFPFYPGYSANFFDGQHYVMKGASARTAACLTRPSFRNWFRPDYPYVYAGFRSVEPR
jgi:iron(II)-dependent oxidoreductase